MAENCGLGQQYKLQIHKQIKPDNLKHKITYVVPLK
jgi:hypothetical protein